jgi:pyruvate dehydrogenase E2 component (dihydrolipoamide acetyltransferase)
MSTEIRLPELGENITEGDVVRILVKQGDVVEKEQPLLELETDKASFDVPSPVAGVVTSIDVSEGGQAVVGKVIMMVDERSTGDDASGEASADSSEDAEQKEKTTQPGTDAGERSTEEKEEAKDSSPPAVESAVPDATDTTDEAAPDDGKKSASDAERSRVEDKGNAPRFAEKPHKEMSAPEKAAPPAMTSVPVPASPSVRMFAREIGVDITAVKGNGPGGRISVEDVKAHAKAILTKAQSNEVAAFPSQRRELPDFALYGGVRREAMSKLRRKTAEQMETAWTIPVVTQHDKADVTRLEELRQRYAKKADAAGVKLTVTAIALRTVAAALKKFPQFNASIDMERQEIIYKDYVHLGVAVDTERGLLVPVIRDADRKSIFTISAELQELAEKARERNIKPDDMAGSSFTVTNLGGIGGTLFTPIINWPEVAILGLSRSVMEPVYIDGAFEPRLMMPLSLTYDHRIIDGADAARFLRWFAEALEEPLLQLLEH